MRINFVLPSNGNRPVGGFKIVFQYANELVRLGHDVSISFLNDLYPERRSTVRKVLSRVIKRKLRKNESRKVTWFNIDSRVKLFYNIIFDCELPTSDVIIATAAQTAKFVAKLDLKFGRKYYFIQGYEDWAYSKNELNATFKLPFQKIVISRWLYDIISRETDDKIDIVPNFLDPQKYYLNSEIKERKNVVAIMYHESPDKNVRFGMEVLNKIKKYIPDLQVKMFGAYKEPKNLPEYYTYYQQPSQRILRDEIYGQAKVYLLPSLVEGWGLTGMEAMCCGSVLVSSDIGGVVDYTINHKNAILVKPNELEKFVTALIDVLTNESNRLKMANNGVEYIKKFNIETSTKLLLSDIKA